MNDTIYFVAKSTKFRCINPVSRAAQQQGAALIVGLIMLLLLTIVGVAGMRETLLQEKMVGNMRDREVALQAAESALRAGENLVKSAGAPPTFTNSNGLYDRSVPAGLAAVERKKGSQRISEQLFWAEEWKWTDAYSREYSRNLEYTADQPRFVVERLDKSLSDRSGYPGVANCGAGVVCAEDWGEYEEKGSSAPDYRITARGVGLTEGTVVILQSTYRRHDGQ